MPGFEMDTPYTPFMRDLEQRFKVAAGFSDRAQYKIYYCQIKEAPILTLGYNPGGAPSNTNPDGRTHKDGVVAAASASYYEGDEHDILDCEWKENPGLRSLLVPLVGSLSTVRQKVVKTNMAFHRSAKKKDLDMERAMVSAFTDRFGSNVAVLAPEERDPGVKQVVFAARSALLRATGEQVTVVQLAHTSQFGWTCERHRIPDRIRALERE